jgi:vacuolar-type H+-ATPase subunit I/STV1
MMDTETGPKGKEKLTTDERIDKLAATVQDLERVIRQGFVVLTELHTDLQRETNQAFQKLANSMSALADHETRLNRLEGK